MLIKLEEVWSSTTREGIHKFLRALLEHVKDGERVIIQIATAGAVNENEVARGGGAMSRTAPKIQTGLSHFVREARGGQTQRDFQKTLGIETPQYVSRVERGMIGMPNERFLVALAAYTARPVEELRGMAKEVR